MLSGIGPEQHLKSLGIKVKANLPVGKNLVDHVAIMYPNFVMDKPVSFNPERDFNINTVVEYIVNGTGTYAHSYFVLCVRKTFHFYFLKSAFTHLYTLIRNLSVFLFYN